MPEMTNAHFVVLYLKEDKIVFKRHHPPASRKTIGRIAFRQGNKRIRGIKQLRNVITSGFSTSGFYSDEITNSHEIAQAAR